MKRTVTTSNYEELVVSDPKDKDTDLHRPDGTFFRGEKVGRADEIRDDTGVRSLRRGEQDSLQATQVR